MKIVNLNIMPSEIEVSNEVLSMYLNILVAETIVSASITSHELLMNIHFEKLPDLEIFLQIRFFQPDDAELMNIVDYNEKMYIATQKLKHRKITDKKVLNLMNQSRLAMGRMRSYLKGYYKLRLKGLNLVPLLGFETEEFLELSYPRYDLKTIHENKYIEMLTEIVGNKIDILSLNHVVEKFFTFVDGDAYSDMPFDCIKIPLWDFPLLDDITYAQMKYTREDLKKALYECNFNLQAFVLVSHDKHYNYKDNREILQIFTNHVKSPVKDVQQAINNSLYLCQIKNKTQNKSYARYNLGITSAANLVNHYERSGMLEAYVCSEVKDRLGRKITMQDMCVFSYCTIEKPDKEQK